MSCDPLIYKIVGSERHSRLGRLPDELLVKIMSCLALEDVLRLRHASRIFMRLFSSGPLFKSHHLTEKQDSRRFCDTVRIWAAPSASFSRQEQGHHLSMCSDCSKFRDGDILGRTLLPNMPWLYCSGCRTMHREMHFSKLQRREKDDSRVRVGHEGCIKLCDHNYLNIRQVKARASSKPLQELVCPYSQNNSAPKCTATTCPADDRARAES